ncbi:MAG: hypothetical protein JKY45_01390 [Emcibacter sp.]|nr:hypothetical protein [Emcibacter sp.]
MTGYSFSKFFKKQRRNQRGAMAVITVICLSLLAGAIAIAVEIGGYLNMATQLQHAADASALAGATQLDRTSGSIARARFAAMGSLVNNWQSFANDNDPDGINIVIETTDIVFLSGLNPRVEVDLSDPDADENADFIEVNVSPRTVNFSFAALITDNTNVSAGARAVAGLGEAICSVPPIMICNPTETATTTEFDAVAYKGRGIILKSGGANSSWAPGNFGLLALNNHNLSTNDIRDAMGRVNPFAMCFSTDGNIGSKPGQSTAVAQGLNVRFDIYEGATGSLDNDPQYAPAGNAVKGMVKAGPQCSYNPNGGNGWTQPDNKYEGPEDLDSADAMGFPRDNCAYSPLSGGDGDCTVGSSTRIGTGNWDIESYMLVNHSPMTVAQLKLALGIGVLDPPPSRYEVYKWESDSGNIVVTAVENAYPQCNTQTPAEGPDRRVISLAVVNCIVSNVQGQTPNLDVETWVDIFLTEPMGASGGNNFLYGEIMGETAEGQSIETVVKYVSQLYE